MTTRTEHGKPGTKGHPSTLRLSEEDLSAALREMGTYVDISEEDLKKLFEIAFSHIHKKLVVTPAKGVSKSPPMVSFGEVLWAGLGAIIGIGICAYISSKYLEPKDLTLLIGSFGASAVLVYAAVKSPLAQPRNLIGGHIISGLAGVASYHAFGSTIWIASAMAVSVAIMAMLLTRTLHPPGGATALIAVIGGPKIHSLGYLYAILPAGAGALILLAVALLVNNLSEHRRYPEYWL